MNRIGFLLIALMSISGCSSIRHALTLAEEESGYTYVPIDPFAVDTVTSDSCKENNISPNTFRSKELLKSLPDNSVRMLVEKFSKKGSVTYGSTKLAAKGESYKVTVDYINADTVNQRMWIKKTIAHISGEFKTVPILDPSPFFDGMIVGTDRYKVSREEPSEEHLKDYEEFNIPVYVGIGLRVSANVNITGGSANVAGIGIIGAEAEAENLQGSLVVQTLGVNGKSISAALPIQSELNRTTAQNAIVSVGSIKALLYEDDTVVFPRVVGLYLPFPGGKPLVNALISELSRKRVEWHRPCVIAAK